MTEQTNLIPKRRFKEFKNSLTWEQRKLGEVADIIGGGTPSTSNKEYWNGDIDWYSPVEIGERTYVDSSQKKITELGLQKCSAKVLPIGTVLFTSRAGIGNTAILANEGATNQGFQSIVPDKDELDSYFIYSRTHELKRYGETNGAGSTFVEVSGKQMAKMPMFFPTLEEQKKIGGFFERLDDLIALNQRKLEKTKALKSAYLSEMFPAEGECEPKRRFAGFTHAWEQCRVGDIFKVTRGQVLAATKTSESKTNDMRYPVYSSQTKNNGLMGYYKDYLFDTAITWTTDGANAGTVNYRKGKFYSTNVNGVLLSDEGYANKAVAEALNLVAWKYVSKVGNPKLMNTVMSDIVISLPSNIEEQKKISEFLESIDHLLSFHERRLEKLQNLKKAYLNEMFV
jgi:type I restriction enzyme, S subunit